MDFELFISTLIKSCVFSQLILFLVNQFISVFMESPTQESFSFSEQPELHDPLKQILFLQFEYEKIKQKYQRLKQKYQEHSDQQEKVGNVKTLSTSSKVATTVDRTNPSQQKPKEQNLYRNQKQTNQNLSDQFTWNEELNQGPVFEQKKFLQTSSKKQTRLHSESKSNLSQTSDNFNFNEQKNQNHIDLTYPQDQSFNKQSNLVNQSQKEVKSSKSNNSGNFSFSKSFNLTVSIDKVDHRISAHNNSDNFELSKQKDIPTSLNKSHSASRSHQSDNFAYQSLSKADQSQNFSYNSFSRSKKQNSDNISFSINKSKHFQHEDLADSKDFRLNQSQILPKVQLRENQSEKLKKVTQIQSQVHNKPQNQKKNPYENSSIKSYDDSKLADTQAFKYELKQYSFRLPQQINDPIEINYSTIEPNHHQQGSNRGLRQSINTNKKLNIIQEDFEYQELSDQDETEFYRKLINKLSIKRKIQISEIKKVSIQMQTHSEKYKFLQEIFQTGTYELDLTQTHELKDQFIKEFKTWNKTLITQLTLNNQWPYVENDSFFKEFEFPSVKSVSFKLKDEIILTDTQLLKKPCSNIDLNFLRYFGLSKKIKSLTLKGETMTQLIATSIVDLDFPLLKTLYLGFQAPLTNEVVNILLCNKHRNIPKCKIYIASWEGTADDRFAQFYDKIDFQFLETDSEDM